MKPLRDSEDSDSNVDLAFAFMDFQNMNFDEDVDGETPQQDRAEDTTKPRDGEQKSNPANISIEVVSILVKDVVDVVPKKKYVVDEREQNLLDLEMSLLLNNDSLKLKQCQTEDVELTEVHAMVWHIQT
mmetsp:Transcript_40383/g.48401  ORF Transcript_40383/g.48401 Transcript_40383/m.48401 type:complete len:129 (-) Transcript_40383:103-489(-)